MKIKIIKENLLGKLSTLSRFTASRFSNTATIQGILFEFNKNNLILSATNLTSFAQTSLKIKGGNPLKFVLEPRKLIEFLTFLSDSIIEFEIENNKVVVVSKKTKGTFSVLKGEDFPTFKTSKENGMEVERELFLNNLPLVIFAASHDEIRPVLSGVNLISTENKIEIVATDGFRLSYLEVENTGFLDIPSIIIPVVFLNEVTRYLKNIETKVGVGFVKEEKTMFIKTNNFSFYTRLIDGEFPPFRKVIPTEFKTSVTVEKEPFLNAVKTSSVLLQNNSNILILRVRKDGLYLLPKSSMKSEENIVFCEGDVKGDEVRVAFNYRFVLDLLNNIPAKSKLRIEILREDAPVVFKVEQIKGFLHLIMPVRIET